VKTEAHANVSHHASNQDKSKLVAGFILFNIHSVSVYIALLSNIFLTGILKLVFHQVIFVQVVLLLNHLAIVFVIILI
jgi:hypothetical protein